MKLRKTIAVRGLHDHATIGVYSPSEPLVKTRLDRFDSGVAILERHGYRVIKARNCLAHTQYSAGSPQQRLDDIHQLILDGSIDALIASWGGKSCNQLIQGLDYENILLARKPVLGFSDGCVLLNAVSANTGLVTFYGPNVVGKLNETEHSSLDLLRVESDENTNLIGDSSLQCSQVVWEGNAVGRLFGGNLSTFVLGVACSNVPKDYWRDGIFFWEEASLPSQLIDQHLTALDNSGLLGCIAGMVIGCFEANEPIDWKRRPSREVIESIVLKHKIPVLYSPSFGHEPVENPILPIGAMCRLETENRSLKLAERICEVNDG